MSLKTLRQELRENADPSRIEDLKKFYQAYPGGYGEGDEFLGRTSVPKLRAISKKFFMDIDLAEVEVLLNSKFHEERFFATEILKFKYQKAKGDKDREEIINVYLSNLEGINNWDLVDNSCYKLLGDWVSRTGDPSILYKLARSSSLWEQRIAIVSTMELIRQGNVKDTIKLSELLVNHPHDLIHKAVGWLLREVGKKDSKKLRSFLDKHHKTMPRTMLRYAIEKMAKDERDRYLGRT